jgi:hypothetical protein
MRIVASACLVLAILFMVGCGTSAEDKKMIQDHGTKLTALEKKIGDVEKTVADHTAKVTTIWDYLAANNVGKAKFPPEAVKPPEPPKPGAKPEVKKEEPKKEEKTTKKEGAKEPGTKK